MTTTQESAVAVEMITVVIDGFEVSVPKGTLVIRAAEKLGIQIPRFCDHPLLDPVGACRQCLVDIEINGRFLRARQSERDGIDIGKARKHRKPDQSAGDFVTS